jgi:hypothetical protein
MTGLVPKKKVCLVAVVAFGYVVMGLVFIKCLYAGCNKILTPK